MICFLVLKTGIFFLLCFLALIQPSLQSCPINAISASVTCFTHISVAWVWMEHIGTKRGTLMSWFNSSWLSLHVYTGSWDSFMFHLMRVWRELGIRLSFGILTLRLPNGFFPLIFKISSTENPLSSLSGLSKGWVRECRPVWEHGLTHGWHHIWPWWQRTAWSRNPSKTSPTSQGSPSSSKSGHVFWSTWTKAPHQ